MTTVKIKIGNKEASLGRLTLKGWAALEEFRKTIGESLLNKDYEAMFMGMQKFIEQTLQTPPNIQWDSIGWEEFSEIFKIAEQINAPRLNFPILMETKGSDPLPWEYNGRSWYFWVNVFASNYGWGEDIISKLDIDDAIGLYQEILISDQMKKEWDWGLAEVAYPYNKATKRQEFKPLNRPKWMMAGVKPPKPKIIKIPKNLMPVGNVISYDSEKQK